MRAPRRPAALLVLLAACLLPPPTTHAQGAASDSLRLQDLSVAAMQDSLALGLTQLQAFWDQAQREQTDSLKYTVQAGPGRAWKEWAFSAAPRRGMSGDDILRLAELHALLNRFDMEGCYNEQLECYKRAMVMPGSELRALRRLHAEYHAAGFAPGMIQTGLRLMEVDRRQSLEMGVARSISQAYYLIGDRGEARRWIRRHLRAHPDDAQARELKSRISKLRKPAD